VKGGVGVATGRCVRCCLYLHPPLAASCHAAERRRGQANARSVRALLGAAGQLSPNAQNWDGETPLHVAAYAGDLHGTRLMLDAGGDPAIEDRCASCPHSRRVQLVRGEGRDVSS
jgi:hypothetical protein